MGARLDHRDVPEEIIAAERKVSRYFAEQGIAGWALGGSCDRRFTNRDNPRFWESTCADEDTSHVA